MTISSTTVKNSYSGNSSTTVFAYTFKIFADSDIQVIIRSSTGTETTKTITTHYTVSGAGDANGGSVTFLTAPVTGETVVLIRNVPQTQAIDYIANDPFPAETHEEGLDRATMTIQQMQEEINRSIKLSKTNTITSTEFTVAAADRANKILAFDSTGEISVTQELGTYKGTDTTVTTEAYVQRDIVKSTSAAQLNNVYICVGDSVVGDLLTDTDHFDLLVDAYSAATSAAAAASSATDAETAQTAAETAQTAAELAETNAATSESNAATSASAAAASADAFDDVYLGSKSSDPTTDNDGDPLAAGMLYYNTVSTIMRIYSGSAWENVAVSTAGFTTLTGVETLTNKTLTAPKIANGGFVADANGNEQIKFTTTASAVNELTVVNSAAGNAPEISSTGGDTDIDLKITPKGSGKIVLDGISFPNADGSSGQFLKTDGSGSLSFADSGLAWQSVVTTSTITVVAGRAYFINTTSNACTVTLPSGTPTAGAQVQLVDYAGTFDTNACTINPNGNKIEGQTGNLNLSGERAGVILTYIDATQGWLATSGINEGTDALSPPPYAIDFLVIAGGGSGGSADQGAGGGAGGYRTSTQTVNAGTVITVTVGDGGSAPPAATGGNNGSNSSISGSGLTTITSTGGGGGGNGNNNPYAGQTGGSGGGSSRQNTAGGLGNTPSTSPSQGNNGGSGGEGAPAYAGGGGGGAGAVGGNGSASTAGNGGAGSASSITGSSVTRAGGGGGSGNGSTGSGGSGGGGAGGSAANGTGGTANTGGGGGGSSLSSPTYVGGAGGKGVVILAFPLTSFSSTTTGSPTESDDGTTKVLIFNGSGSYTT
jgi:hypothetical protein